MKSATFLYLPPSHRLCLFILATCLILTLTCGVKAQSGITYVYDELGRLIAVTDPAGDTVRYTYDAVGNVLSISRQSSSTLSIVHFNPKSGPVGTSVTIYGTAFSTTPSQNTVTFNGVTATVVSSTATQIVTTVPTGATTGLINVTTSAGTVSSSTSFTVSASSAPTISSFTPTIGAAGTSVTVTGTNFDTTASKNKTKFNITHAVVSSASATSISTNVPLISGSGKITVSTPNGAAVSTDDFFVPPSPYTASAVAVTGRMTSGGSQTVNISTASKIGMILFEASAGQRAAVKVTSSSITSTKVSILNSHGAEASWAMIGPSGGIVDTPTLNSSGTHTIVVDPNASYTGSLTFTLYVFNDLIGSITPGGSAVTVTTTTPGQNGRLNFAGNANQRVSLKMSSVSLTGGSNFCTVSLKKPDGTTLTSKFFGTNPFIDTQTLPTTGTYTLVVDPADSSIGSVTLTLYDVPADTTGSITAGGSAVTVTTTVAGQNGQMTFSGTANQRVSLKMTSLSLTGGSNFCTVSLKKPDGTTLTSKFFGTNSFIDTQTLPTTGTYTILVDPADSSTGSVTLTLYDVPADTTGSITAGGSAVTVTTTIAGQNGLLTFSGTSNQRVSLKMTSLSLTGGSNFCTVSLKKPDGTTLTSKFFGGDSFIDTQTLPVTGTYTILVDPADSSTGSVTLTLYDVPADLSGSVTIGGSSINVAPSVPGQNASLTFSGTSSQQITVRITNNTMSCITVTLKQPSGATVTSSASCNTSFNLSTQTLPATGTYTITLDPMGASTGSLNVSVTNP